MQLFFFFLKIQFFIFLFTNIYQIFGNQKYKINYNSTTQLGFSPSPQTQLIKFSKLTETFDTVPK